MKYIHPRLYPIDYTRWAFGGCAPGAEPAKPACAVGPEAVGGMGCGSGISASHNCKDGAVAGISCKTGTGHGPGDW